MPDIVRAHATTPARGWLPNSRLARRADAELAQLEVATVFRVAAVQAEGLVQGTKVQEIDHLAREAMTGQALLSKWRDTLAAQDPLLNDELRFFTDVARVGKGEVIAETITSYSRECRR